MNHRSDIQGLRAVAVLLVVAAHSGVPGLSGGFIGVDVFFVLSGFLITSLLLNEHNRTGLISLPGFWARRARRILPAASLVLVVTAVASYQFVALSARTAWREDMWWATGFAANWRFAITGSDYLNQGDDPSVVQHYWSLGVEEQFYVVFPLVVLGAFAFARWRNWSGRTVLLSAVSVIGLVSFVWCVYQSASNSPVAYYSTFTRAWQLSVGSILAMCVPFMSALGVRVRGVLGAASIVLLALSAVAALDEGRFELNYPSALALGPTLASAGLIAAGCGGLTWVGRALSGRMLAHIGDMSYSWYLWHWPFLIIGWARFGNTPAVTALLVFASFSAAALTLRFVENPIRYSAPLRPARLSLSVGLACVLATIPAASIATAGSTTTTVVSGPSQVQPTPSLVDAADDLDPVMSGSCLVASGAKKVVVDVDRCTFGTSPKQVYVIGDSIAAAMSPAVFAAARKHGWSVVVLTRARCPFIDATAVDTKYQGGAATVCRRTAQAALDLIEQERPIAVVTTMTNSSARALLADESDPAGERLYDDQARSAAVAAQRRYLESIRATGAKVVALDSPAKADFEPSKCLDQKKSSDLCSFPRVTKPLQSVAALGAAGAGVTVVDVNSEHCSSTSCGPLAGRWTVYRDDVHFTATYASTFSSKVTAAINR